MKKPMTDTKRELQFMLKIKSGKKKWEKYTMIQPDINKLNSYTWTESNNTSHLSNNLHLPKFFHIFTLHLKTHR